MNDTVYVVMWSDRHTDPTATVFTTADAAISCAPTNAPHG